MAQMEKVMEKKEEEKGSWSSIITFGVGFILLVIGYIILSFVNSQGDNWASVVSPLMIIGSYIIIAISFLL